jgi:predicted permease
MAMRSEWNQRNRGLSEEESSALAKRQFGGKLQVREAIEDLYPGRLLAEVAQDLHHALRICRSSPGFAAMAIITVAAGIAAATTVFSIVDPLLFRSLPFRDDAQLVSVGVLGPIDTNEFAMGGMYLDWRDHQKVFSSMAAMRPGTQCDLQFATTDRVPCVAVGQHFLTTLGVNPVMGRNFTREEDQPHAPRTMLISSRLWREHFGSQPGIVGRLVKVDDGWVRVIGVLPSNFVMPQGADVDVLLPAQLDQHLMADPASTVFLRLFARLKAGTSVEQARQEMAALFTDAIRRYVPAGLQREVHPVIRSVRDRIIHEAALASRMLLGAVTLVLLMACLTLTNLLVARAYGTRNELAMRATLGASRNRLVRQCLTETLLFASAGGAIGFALSWAGMRVLVHAAPGGFLHLERARVDGRVLAFAVTATLLAAIVAGVLPAFQLPGSSLIRSWRMTSTATARLRQGLTSLQLACSLVLLTGALLFARSLSRLESQQPGFSQNRLTTVSIRLSRPRYAKAGLLSAFYDQLETKLQAIPGVEAVALSDSMPPAGGMHGRPLSNIQVAGRALMPGASGMVSFRYVSPSYFRTLRIPILRGRTFTDADRREPQSSVVFSKTLSRLLFPSTATVGQRVSMDGGEHWLTVIGVVGDVKNNGMNVAAWPEYYHVRTIHDERLGLMAIAFVRSALGSRTLERWIRQEITTLDPTASMAVETMPERLNRLNDRPRFLTFVLGIFAVVSVLLAGAGLYGVISFLVSGRTREIGIRSALGATRRDIIVMVQRQMFWCAAIGLASGLTGCLVLTRFVRGLLFQISPYDPVVLSSAAVCFFLIILTACSRPAWKAARIDPAQALRVD